LFGNRQIVSFHEIVLNIMKHLNLDELIDEIIHQAAYLVEAPAGFSCFVEQDQHNGRFAVVDGLKKSVDHYSLPIGEGAIDEVLKSGQALVIDDYSVYPKQLAHFAWADFKTMVIIPVYSLQKVIGVIGVYFNENKSFLADQLELLTRLAELTAVAIDNSRLYEHVQKELLVRTQHEAELLESEEKYRLVFESVNDAIGCLDVTTLRFIGVNHQLLALFGCTQAELNSQTLFDLTDEPEKARKLIENVRSGKLICTEERWRMRRNEMNFLAELRATSFWWRGTLVLCAVMRDITDRKFQEDKMAYFAYHDMLTGLPNRRLIEDRLQTAVAQAKRNQTLLAVLFLDFDGMKPINDALGHEVGDEFLKDMAKRLVTCTRDGDTVARLGGDEFVIVLPELVTQHDAEEIAQRLIDQCQGTFTWQSHLIEATVSIGISFFPDHGNDSMILIKYADRAMYQAKRSGGKQFCIYEA